MIDFLMSCAIAMSGSAGQMAKAPDPAPIAPARDGNIAIEEELEAARKAKSLAAYDLFIARHPAHPLAATARKERRRLASR